MSKFSDYRPSPMMIEAVAARQAAGEKAARVREEEEEDARRPVARQSKLSRASGGRQRSDQ